MVLGNLKIKYNTFSDSLEEGRKKRTLISKWAFVILLKYFYQYNIGMFAGGWLHECMAV
jgi:hypothetical protein